MGVFCFTIDDNIRFLKEISEQKYGSMFDHPYLAMLKRLHERFELSIQLNLFYALDDFDLSMVSDRYADEWEDNADWLKLSFHSRIENERPYENSDYTEVFDDCNAVHKEILRFASQRSLAKTTTIHYCRTTNEGLRALSDNGIVGLLGLFGSDEKPRTSYSLSDDLAVKLREGEVINTCEMAFASIDMIVNLVSIDKIESVLGRFLGRDSIRVMIHEQYFYEDYKAYQPNFEEKLTLAFEILTSQNYKSCFFEDMI